MKKPRAQIILSVLLAFVLTALTIVPYPVANAADKVSENDPQVQELKDKIAALNDEIAASKAKQQELQNEMDSVAVSASSLQSQADELQAQIDAYNIKISALNNQISALNAQIEETENSIKETEAQIEEQQIKIEETQKLLGERMRAMYMAGNVSYIEIILEADSFESLLNRLELVAQVARHDSKIVEDLESQISELQEMIEALEAKRVQLEADKQDMEAARSEQVTAKNELSSKKSELSAKLNVLRGYLANLEDDSDELAQFQREAQARQDAYDAQIFRMLNGISSSGDGTLSGGMIWPVAATGCWISSGYGNRTMSGESTSFHRGIDVVAAGASGGNVNIVSAATGVVVLINNSCGHNYPKSSRYEDPHYNTYGNCVYIDHGNGVITRYGHLGRVNVSQGQTVSMGQIIGTMGCTGYSTGFHLHFEVRVNGEPVNPLNYVSVR